MVELFFNFMSCSNHEYSNMIQHTAERQPPKSPDGGLYRTMRKFNTIFKTCLLRMLAENKR